MALGKQDGWVLLGGPPLRSGQFQVKGKGTASRWDFEFENGRAWRESVADGKGVVGGMGVVVMARAVMKREKLMTLIVEAREASSLK